MENPPTTLPARTEYDRLLHLLCRGVEALEVPEERAGVLVEITALLRGSGYDDDGGLECPETDHIPVAEISGHRRLELAVAGYQDNGPVSHLIDGLILAGAGIRDLHMGWPEHELYTGSDRTGLGALISSIENHICKAKEKARERRWIE